ncbi:beta strand repeat-containing protein [Vibrio ziniensis]|uniref:Cadherin-like domain-containing protein n=1 Tax=Vibrio ziniensis TaxID=2711221 RepID=A0A6G7CHL1_9VIBR|nr:cadherin-like domain-containing protein [Vibrio ziniensis]QIH41579.1 cadherin-like domain-containing protein [Vibrio ziniensis]
MDKSSLLSIANLAINQMIVIDKNGDLKIATIGEKLPEGTVIIQRGDEMISNDEFVTKIIGPNNEPQNVSDDVAQLLSALEEGQDPTQLGDELAPAAGGSQGSSLTDSASVERSASETIATTSFSTTGFESLGFSQTQSLALISLTSTSSNSAEIVTQNSAPNAENDTITVNEDTSITIDVLNNDIDEDGDALTIVSATVSEDEGTIEIVDGKLVFTPAENFNGEVSIEYTITDNQGGTDTAQVTVTVNAVNDAPTTTSVDLGSVEEDGSVLITTAQLLANASDIESDTLFISGLTASRGSLVDNGDGTWTYTPEADDDSAVSFSYTITDNGTTDGESDPQSVSGSATLDITPVNDAPTTSAVNLGSVEEDGSVLITTAQLLANASDIESDTLFISGLTASRGSLVDNGDGTWTYTPVADDDSAVSFSYTITDNGTTDGESDPQSVSGSATLDITPVNDAPTTTSVDLGSVEEDGSVLITTAQLLANASDIESDTLSISGLTASSGSLVDNGDGTWTYTPVADDDSAVSFSYTITDNGTTDGESDPQSVSGSATLDITPVNDAPTTTSVDLGSVEEDGSVLITTAQLLANASDIESDTLSISGLTASSGSLVDNGDGTWTYTPAANDDNVSFSYTITDNGETNGVADPKSVQGSAVLEVNNIPTIDLNFDTSEDATHSVSVSAETSGTDVIGYYIVNDDGTISQKGAIVSTNNWNSASYEDGIAALLASGGTVYLFAVTLTSSSVIAAVSNGDFDVNSDGTVTVSSSSSSSSTVTSTALDDLLDVANLGLVVSNNTLTSTNDDVEVTYDSRTNTYTVSIDGVSYEGVTVSSGGSIVLDDFRVVINDDGDINIGIEDWTDNDYNDLAITFSGYDVGVDADVSGTVGVPVSIVSENIAIGDDENAISSVTLTVSTVDGELFIGGSAIDSETSTVIVSGQEYVVSISNGTYTFTSIDDSGNEVSATTEQYEELLQSITYSSEIEGYGTITITVTDDAGQTATATSTIYVESDGSSDSIHIQDDTLSYSQSYGGNGETVQYNNGGNHTVEIELDSSVSTITVSLADKDSGKNGNEYGQWTVYGENEDGTINYDSVIAYGTFSVDDDGGISDAVVTYPQDGSFTVEVDGSSITISSGSTVIENVVFSAVSPGSHYYVTGYSTSYAITNNTITIAAATLLANDTTTSGATLSLLASSLTSDDSNVSDIAYDETTGSIIITLVDGVSSSDDSVDISFSYKATDGTLISDAATVTLSATSNGSDTSHSFEGFTGDIDSAINEYASANYDYAYYSHNTYGTSGNDHIVGYNYYSDTLASGDGDDWIQGQSGSDIIDAGDGDDLLQGGSGNDTLYGGDGNDILVGGNDEGYYCVSDNDKLYGGDGNDVLIGGSGHDILTGGDGSDLFVLGSGSENSDTIVDFDSEEDAIDISDLLDVGSSDDIQSYIEAHITISTDSEGAYTLEVTDSSGCSSTSYDAATFGQDSNIGSGDIISVIFNNQEYKVTVD